MTKPVAQMPVLAAVPPAAVSFFAEVRLPRLSSWRLRSFDRHLTVELNANRR
jgi:hypothetical protein